MKKPVKIIVGAVVAIVALVLILVLALPLWIGPVATGVANSVVPGITGTDFRLGQFGLNPYSGVLTVGAMDLSNPPKYEEKTAVKLDSLKVDVAMTTLCGKVIHVEDIALDGLYVYASGLTADNFQDIARHATGADKTKGEEAKPAAEGAKPAEAKKPADKKAEGGKKVCIDHLVLRNIKVKIGMLPAMPIPTIELRDLGKPKDESSEGGITFEELWQTIIETVMAATGSITDGLKALGGLADDAASQAVDAANKAAEAVGSVASGAADAANKAASQATEAVGNAASQTTKAVGSVASGAAGAVGEGAKAVGNVASDAAGAVGEGAKAVGNAAGEGVKAVGEGAKAVGEGAKKAVDALKSLW